MHPRRLRGAPAVERTFSFAYAKGFLTAVPGYASSISYHANGMVNQVAHANGVTDTQAVDTTNWMSRPQSISTSGASANWSTGTYKYDGAGNVTGIGQSHFRYDRVSRLKTADLFVESGAGNVIFADGFESGDVSCWDPGSCLSGGQMASQTYTFDTFGNINQIATTAGAPTVTRLTPTDWITNRLTGTAVYDAAGNLTSWNGAVYQYEKLNKMWRMQNGAEEWLYLYTADDERLWSFKVGANFSRWTLRDLNAKVLREYITDAIGWSVAADYVYRDGLLLAAETRIWSEPPWKGCATP